MALSHRLGIDFGTTNTVAMLTRPDGRTRPLLFDESPVLPSAVFLRADGAIEAGRDAARSALADPARYEPNPKRRIDEGTLLLGSIGVPVVDAIAAVFRRVAVEVGRVAGGSPVETVLTHPAAWGAARRGILLDAARSAGLDVRGLVPEPIAAASYFTSVLGHTVPSGRALAVYDFGAGTFDASVLARAGAGFQEVAVGGLDSVGGLDLDEAIVGWLAAGLGERHPQEWHRLTHPASPADLRSRRLLWDEVRGAKEALSRQASTNIFVPLIDADVLINRDDLERIAGPLVLQTVAATQTVLRHARVKGRVADLFLVGGSSRVPLVATALHRRLGMPPVVTDQPELVVAEGSLHATVVPVPVPALEAVAPVPVEAPAEDPVEAWVEDPVEVPVEAWVEDPVEAPAEELELRPWHKVVIWCLVGAVVVAALFIDTVGTSDDDPGTAGPVPSTTAPSGSPVGPPTAAGPPAAWLARPTVTDTRDLVMSRKALARRGGTTVTFLDPATGKDTGSITVAAPAGVRSPTVQRVTLVDTADDTLVVFFYRVTHREDGLSPERDEYRVQVRSRASGRQTLDTALILGAERWREWGWSMAKPVATDPRGYLVINYLPSGGAEPNLFHVLGLLPGLTSWTVSEDCCPRSVAGLAVNNGVLLASRVGAEEELRGYDLATGRQLWRQEYRNDSIVDRHPDCAGTHKGLFILRNDKVPMILDARSGAVVKQNNGGNCLTFDSATATGVQGRGDVTGYDLDTGNALWTVPYEQVRSLALKVVGVYGGRVYVTTKSDRLVLDARTGKEVARGWTVAPVAGYDSWVVGFDAGNDRESVYPGTG